jgi:hypothetical protein
MMRSKESKIKDKFNQIELAHFLKQNLASKLEKERNFKESKNCKSNE